MTVNIIPQNNTSKGLEVKTNTSTPEGTLSYYLCSKTDSILKDDQPSSFLPVLGRGGGVISEISSESYNDWFDIRDMYGRKYQIRKEMLWNIPTITNSFIDQFYINEYGYTPNNPLKITFNPKAIFNTSIDLTHYMLYPHQQQINHYTIQNVHDIIGEKQYSTYTKLFGTDFIRTMWHYANFLHINGLSEYSIKRYCQQPHRGSDKHMSAYEGLFVSGMPLDAKHNGSRGDAKTGVFHIKDHKNRKLSRDVCRFWASYFGLDFRNILYFYRRERDRRSKFLYRKNPTVHYIKFDGSGLDFSCLGLLIRMFELRNQGYVGLDLVKKLGPTKLLKHRGSQSPIYDYRVRE